MFGFRCLYELTQPNNIFNVFLNRGGGIENVSPVLEIPIRETSLLTLELLPTYETQKD